MQVREEVLSTHVEEDTAIKNWLIWFLSKCLRFGLINLALKVSSLNIHGYFNQSQILSLMLE